MGGASNFCRMKFFSDGLNLLTNVAMHFPVSWDDLRLGQDGRLKTLYSRCKSKNDLLNDLLKFTPEAIPACASDSDGLKACASGPEALNTLRSNQTFMSGSQDLSLDLALFMY